MKRMNKFVCALLMGCVLFTGCGSNSGTSTTTTEEITTSVTDSQASTEGEQTDAEDSLVSSVTGMVESIDESSITVSVMGTPGGAPGGNAEGDAPADMPGNAEGGAPTDMPSNAEGGAPTDMPSNAEGGAPADMPGNAEGGAPADMPSDGENGAPADIPSGNTEGGTPADMPGDMNAETNTYALTASTLYYDESGNEISIADITEGTMVTVALDEAGNAVSISLTSMQMGMGGPDSGQGAPTSYEALNEYTEDTTISNETITSTGTDENAIHVTEGACVTLDQVSLTRTSSDSTGGDSSSFYGVGAAILVTDGSVEITDSTIDTAAAGGAGVFAYGDGVATVSNTTITTTENTSGGIHVAGGGTLYANNLTIETSGESAAAIRSDRGSGLMVVSEGSYTSNGTGSPAVYCTADITVEDATLTATGSEAVCIEGLNSLFLSNCDVTGNMPDLSQNDCTWTVILYQSMSGDSEVGNSTYTMTDGSLTSLNGGLFYTTNTESTFYLSNVDITYSDSNDFFLKCTGNQNQRGWGQSGANGADCSFTADSQAMEGDIIWDSISTLEFIMESGSTLTGAFIQDESCAGTGGSGYANLSIDESSTWIVTGDSTLTSLSCKGSIQDEDGNTVTIVDADGNVLSEGTSAYTITVSSYEGN